MKHPSAQCEVFFCSLESESHTPRPLIGCSFPNRESWLLELTFVVQRSALDDVAVPESTETTIRVNGLQTLQFTKVEVDHSEPTSTF